MDRWLRIPHMQMHSGTVSGARAASTCVPHTHLTPRMHADDVHVHIHFSHPADSPAPFPGPPGGAQHAARAPTGEEHARFSAPPRQLPGTSAATAHAPAAAAGAGAPDPCAWGEYMPAHSHCRGLPPPMQLPLQPLTRLVAFDDALADLVSEVDTMLESQSGGHGRGSLREDGGEAPRGVDDAADCWGIERLREWVSGQTGACIDANTARVAPDARPSRLSGGGNGSVKGGAGMHAAGRPIPAEAARPRRRGAVETVTRTQHPAGVRVDCRSRNEGEAGRPQSRPRCADAGGGGGGGHADGYGGSAAGAHAVQVSVPHTGSGASRPRASGSGGMDIPPTDRAWGGGLMHAAADNACWDPRSGAMHSSGHGADGADGGGDMHDVHAYIAHATRSPQGGGGHGGGRDVQGRWVEAGMGAGSELGRGCVEGESRKVGGGAGRRARAQPRGNVDAHDDAVLSILNDLF